MLIRATFVILIVGGSLLAAPIPRHRSKPPPVPAAGVWQLTWGGSGAMVTLSADGAYHCRWGTVNWSGSWGWDERTRTLHVQESDNGHVWLTWQVQLDGELTGEAAVGVRRIPMTLRKVTTQPTPDASRLALNR